MILKLKQRCRQMHCHSDWEQSSSSLTAYASGATECCYAQIEKEALTCTWACDSSYILEMKFLIEMDHKPLLGVKHLDSLPPLRSCERDVVLVEKADTLINHLLTRLGEYCSAQSICSTIMDYYCRHG